MNTNEERTRQCGLVLEMADQNIAELEDQPGDTDTEKRAADLRDDFNAVLGLITAAPELSAALSGLLEQVHQMRGMFDDEDGTIQAAIDDSDAALSLY